MFDVGNFYRLLHAAAMNALMLSLIMHVDYEAVILGHASFRPAIFSYDGGFTMRCDSGIVGENARKGISPGKMPMASICIILVPSVFTRRIETSARHHFK